MSESAWAEACGSVRAAQEAVAPKPESLQTILSTGPSAWRVASLELYAWDRFPSILVMDTISYSVQDRMFSRMAFFLEKRGFRGRILTNRELEGRHGWNAHDYGPEGLAAFFNAMSESPVPLSPEERVLRAIALRQGLIAERQGWYSPGRGGMLAISQSSSLLVRKLLLTHESFHGLFFLSGEYRDVCFNLWDNLSLSGRSFFLSLLGSLGYDTSDRYLAVNEMQAYLLQQPLGLTETYLKRTAERFPGEKMAASLAAVEGELLQTARRLDGYVSSHFGFGAGETLLGLSSRRDVQ